MAKRFRIERERVDSHDHFLTADYQWRVVEIATGTCVATFTEAMEGVLFTGVEKVELSADEREAIATSHDGTVERVALP